MLSRLILPTLVAAAAARCPGACPGAKMWQAASEDMAQ